MVGLRLVCWVVGFGRVIRLKTRSRIGGEWRTMVVMQEIDGLDLGTTPYDGCGKCFVGVVRLSSMNETTDSPEKQVEHCREEARANGGHIVGWAVDLDVSGATDPFGREGIGPWLRNEKGPYGGIVASDVDRIGRNLVDVLITGYFLRDNGKLIITRGHHGPWDLCDANDEQAFTFKALGAQMEHRSAKRRISETVSGCGMPTASGAGSCTATGTCARARAGSSTTSRSTRSCTPTWTRSATGSSRTGPDV
jgi:Resolvase, N terminal domain